MVTAAQQAKIKFISRPYQRRPGLIPMAIALILAWSIALMAFTLAIEAVRYFALGSAFMLFGAFALAVYLLFMTYKWLKASHQKYELFIDGDLVNLSTYDRQQNIRVNQRISLREVTSAEYYEPRDTANLLLKSPSDSLEIPLWSFGPNAEQKIVSYVRFKGVPIIGIPSDVVI